MATVDKLTTIARILKVKCIPMHMLLMKVPIHGMVGYVVGNEKYKSGSGFGTGPNSTHLLYGQSVLESSSLQLPMDNFYSSCIKNLVTSGDGSPEVGGRGSQVTVSRLPNFGDMAPYLEQIRDKSLSLMVARWLAEQLEEKQEKMKALESAISIATQCLEQAQTEVLGWVAPPPHSPLIYSVVSCMDLDD